MNILRYGTQMMERATPAGVVLTGAAVALTVPQVRRGFRGAAVLLMRGILQASDQVQSTFARAREEMGDFMAEARQNQNSPNDGIQPLMEKAKEQRHRLAVATAAGILTVSDKANAMREEFESIMEEAKTARDTVTKVNESSPGKS